MPVALDCAVKAASRISTLPEPPLPPWEEPEFPPPPPPPPVFAVPSSPAPAWLLE